MRKFTYPKNGVCKIKGFESRKVGGIVILDSFQLSQGKGGELIGMSMQAKTYKYNGKTVEKKP